MGARIRLAAILIGLVAASPLAAQETPEAPDLKTQRREYAAGEAAFRAGNFGDAYLRLLPLAQAEHAQAQLLMGRLSDNGLGPIALDPAEAFRWYLRAAQNGSGPARFAVAKAYATGRGVDASAPLAVEWLTKASQADHVPAILALAALYREGRGVNRDLAMAAKLERHAADLGSPEAEFLLGERLQDGQGGTEKASKEMLSRAAAAGHPGALLRLGRITASAPDAPPEERIHAFVYLTLAAQRGGDDVKRDAQQEIAAVKATLSPEELATAQTELRDWKPAQQLHPTAAAGDDDLLGLFSANANAAKAGPPGKGKAAAPKRR